jgi:hypothetical protein
MEKKIPKQAGGMIKALSSNSSITQSKQTNNKAHFSKEHCYQVRWLMPEIPTICTKEQEGYSSRSAKVTI